MTPYYSKDGIVLFCGDNREVLPTLGRFDITVSSPPYNQIASSEPSGLMAEHNHKQNVGYAGYADDMPEEDYQAWMVETFGTCREMCDGLVWINHKTRFRDKQGIHPLHVFPWPFYSEIVWDRAVSITLNANKFAPCHEFIYGFGTPHYWNAESNTLMTVWRINPERNVKGHTCPFPVSIPSRCITASCPLGGTVLDPFAGSGTTLLAAKLEGRQCTGIEINEDYCRIAVERLRQRILNFGEG